MERRIIIVADNVSTRFGGEAFVPFNYFRLLRARDVDVRLVVHARNRPELTERFPQDLDRMHFVEDTWLHKFLFRAGEYLPRRLAEATTGLLIHLITQREQLRIVRDLIRRFGADVVHQPIPVSPKAPSLIYGVEAPVMMGPLNGGMEYPPYFQKSVLSNIGMALGRGVAVIVNFVIPGKRLARLILVANRRTRDALPLGIRGQIIEVVENGVDLSIWQKKPTNSKSDPLIRLVFVGRLIDLKAVDVVLEAIHSVREQVEVSFEVIGEGPMRQAWQQMTEQLGLGSRVKFSGFMSQPECALRLRQADASVMPSLIECGGAVVLEAMATGLPVIATAWGGPLDYLDETCGILVKPDSREALVRGFADAIIRLAQSPSLREQMGQAGYERARQHFDWERKIDQMLDLYASLSPSDARPSGT